MNHGWKIRVAMWINEDLYGTFPDVPITIGDVEIDQHLFVGNSTSHLIILGQHYITFSSIETKVLDNGTTFARVRSLDRRKAIQYLIVHANHERKWNSFRGDASDF